jgi:hypothetical protein
VYEYEQIKNIYLNNRIKLVARSETHSKAISDAWNINPKIAYNFDIDQIIKD